jgi:hypothetical protein
MFGISENFVGTFIFYLKSDENTRRFKRTSTDVYNIWPKFACTLAIKIMFSVR